MKRSLCALCVLVLMFVAAGASAAAEPQITDVPSNHWAYQSVKKLVSQGYLGLYPDNTFRGDQPVDRYTLAVLVARLLSDSVAGKTALSKDDASLLRTLTGEFRQELAAVASRTNVLEESLAQYQRDRAAMGADLIAWRSETMEVRESLAKAAQDIIDLKERLAALEKRVEVEHAEMVQKQAELQIRLDGELTAQKERTEELAKEVNTWKWIALGAAAVAAILGVLGIVN